MERRALRLQHRRWRIHWGIPTRKEFHLNAILILSTADLMYHVIVPTVFFDPMSMKHVRIAAEMNESCCHLSMVSCTFVDAERVYTNLASALTRYWVVEPSVSQPPAPPAIIVSLQIQQLLHFVFEQIDTLSKLFMSKYLREAERGIQPHPNEDAASEEVAEQEEEHDHTRVFDCMEDEQFKKQFHYLMSECLDDDEEEED